MAVIRYRSIEDMPPPWKSADDVGNLRRVAEMMCFYRTFAGFSTAKPGVRSARNIEEIAEERNDPYRLAPRREAIPKRQ